MATRLTGFSERYGLSRPVGLIRSWSRLKQLTVSGVLLLVVLAACSSTNTYPIDVYSAMHYQHSYRTLEPPRFQAPENAVPIQGRAPAYAVDQITQLENPVAGDEASIARGQLIFDVNCAVCHGEQGNADGPMAPILEANGANRPAVLVDERLAQVPDSHFYNIVTNGLGQWMPAFGNLIPGQDIWDLVNYIRTLQAATQ